MGKKNKKLWIFNKYNLMFIFIFIFFIVCTGITYAYYGFQVEEESVIAGNVISIDADLKVELVVGTNTKMVPMNGDALSNALNAVDTTNGACVDSVGNLSCQVYKITLTNNGSRLKHLKGTIKLYAKDGTGNVYNNLKWRELENQTTIKENSRVNGMSESILVKDLVIQSKKEKIWYIAVWINEANVDQRETDKGLFGGTVTFSTEDLANNVFTKTILEPNAKSDADIDFSKTSESSNTNGIYLRSGTEDNTNPIYYYRGNVNNNLVFADTCWKVVRTTDTGGLKLIYNGIPIITENSYSVISNEEFIFDDSTSRWRTTNDATGYYGNIELYILQAGDYIMSYELINMESDPIAYIYINGVLLNTYEGNANGTIELNDLYEGSKIEIRVEFSNPTSYDDHFSFSLENKNENEIRKYNCNNTGTSTQIGTIQLNNYANSAAYVGYMYSTVYSNTRRAITYDSYYYGKNVTYSNGTYTLGSAEQISDSLYSNSSRNHHYTCFSSTGTTCSGEVYYIYFTDSNAAYYITLTNGKNIDDALLEMFGSDMANQDNYNTTSSAIKGNSTLVGTIDYWYYNNIELKGYKDYLEDTVWCNDRTISFKAGWDPNNSGVDAKFKLIFSGRGRLNSNQPNLSCSRVIDSFTANEANGNGKLDYPVGLLTSDEIMLAGGGEESNHSYYLYTGNDYWSGSPSEIESSSAYKYQVDKNGILETSVVSNKLGVRPSVSLKPGFSIIDGNGATANPYVVQ